MAQKQTEVIVLDFSNTNDINVNVNIPFSVKSFTVKCITVYDTDAGLTSVKLLWTSMISSSRGIIGAVYGSPDAPVITDNCFQSVPNVTYYYKSPTSINGSYLFGFRDYDYSYCSSTNMVVVLQVEFSE